MTKDYSTVPASKKALSEWENASIFTKWSFSVANPMLSEGQKKTLEFDDLLHIPKRDHAGVMLAPLREAYRTSTSFWFLPRLMIALFKFSIVDMIIVSLFTLLDAAYMLVTPLLLNYLLKSLEDEDSEGRCYMWAALLSGVAFLQVVNRHTYVFIAMRMGWNWKNATTALIHEKLIQMDVNILQSSGSGTGMMVNMISNDVARFEEFPIVSHASCFISIYT